ncbi:selenocysteine-specific translation elongation factor [soil metagenome]
MRRLVLGTAGHIDHGKTTLVHALTGTDTDRLPEEKRRGMTIDLGFALLPLADDIALSIIDVPGHEAFIRNMVAGASGIDLVMLVISADEGVMPQTREHLAIIELLGIRRGVIALTRADLVDDDWIELVRDDVTSLLAASALADAPVVTVSARTGRGIDELIEALHATSHQVERRRDGDLFRMPIDRVFTVHGTGTVVTGTVWSGTLDRGRQVRIEPAGITARPRGLQQHGAECDVITAGSRAAIALAGIDRNAIGRGDSVIDAAGWSAATILTVDVSVIADADAPLRTRQRVRVHLGTAEVIGRVALLSQPLEPGSRAILQLRLEQPVLARAGDRLVIRSWSPIRTVAGGTVLEPSAIRRKRLSAADTLALRQLANPDTALDGALSLAGDAGISLDAAPVLTGLPPAAVRVALVDMARFRTAAGRILPAAPIAACGGTVLELLHAFHAANPLADGPERDALRRMTPDAGDVAFDVALDDLLRQDAISTAGSAIAIAGHSPTVAPSQVGPVEEIATVYAAAGLTAPELGDLPGHLAGRDDLPLLLRHLERNGRLVRLTPTRWSDAAAVAAATAALRAALGTAAHPVAAYKDTLGLTRKHLMPLLEFLDRTGVSRRAGDVRTLIYPPKP